MAYDMKPDFEYDPNEYIMVEDRLKRMVREAVDIRDEMAALIKTVDPSDEATFPTFYKATQAMAHALYRHKWAQEVIDKHDEKEKDAGINEHGHVVRDDDVPWLFWFLQIQRRDLARRIIDHPRHPLTVNLTGFFNTEGYTAMAVFVDDFVQIAPSLRSIDLGDDDPLRNTI